MSDVHRHYPEADPEVMQRAQLLGIGEFAGQKSDDDRIERDCRDCGLGFSILRENEHKRSKWYSLCPFCLADEI